MMLTNSADIDALLATIDFGDSEVIPAVAQDERSGAVLMIGFMNDDAVRLTLETGLAHFYSRSRQRIWKKGESSGNTQRIESLSINCDSNSLLLQVIQDGAVCHDGYRTCYYRRLSEDGKLEISIDRSFDPNLVYGDGKEAIQRWIRAYSHLRNQVDPSESSTARMMRDQHLDAAPRVADELEELAGVIDGSHRHGDLQDDLVLESSQVFYWLMVLAANRDMSISDMGIAKALASTIRNDETGFDARLIRSEAVAFRNPADPIEIEQVLSTIERVSQTVANHGIDPLQVIEYDLEEMRTRPYLSSVFS